MPRNAQGVMSLPSGNPVVPGTLIESTWANPTMSDLANEITKSLPRDGTAGMTGPLMLARDGILPLEAVAKRQLDAALNGSDSYMPAGVIQIFAFSAIPTGWKECDGSALSRTTYANLFATIGTTYGVGNGTTTFNIPDLRGEFVRGLDSGRNVDPTRTLGSAQTASNVPHNHGATDPGHTHGASQPAHAHGVSDPGHVHVNTGGIPGPTGGIIDITGGPGGPTQDIQIDRAYTGIGINNAQPGVTVNAAATGIVINNDGVEGRPRNVAMIYCIKLFGAMQTDGLGSMAFQSKNAVEITGGTGVFTDLKSNKTPVDPTDVLRLTDISTGIVQQVLSDDSQTILIDAAVPSAPVIRPQTNIPNGLVKLNDAGQIALSMIPLSDINYQGPWDASAGQTPTQAFPLVTFHDGDMYQVSVAGTMTVYNASGVASATVCGVGSQIIYTVGSPTLPVTGWYFNPVVSPTSLPANQITFAPSGSIVATDVQAAIQELDGDISTKQAASTAVTKDSSTGAAQLPVGTVAQRPAVPSKGQFRYNDDTDTFEGYTETTGWGAVGGSGAGATGGGSGTAKDAAFYECDLLITQDYTIGQDAMVSGATISIATPAVITLTNTFVAGQPVRFTTTGALPTGLSSTVAYYVIATGLSGASFQVSTTLGGSAVNTSGTQSGVHSCGKIKNAGSFGNVTIDDATDVTIPSGASWTIVGG